MKLSVYVDVNPVKHGGVCVCGCESCEACGVYRSYCTLQFHTLQFNSHSAMCQFLAVLAMTCLDSSVQYIGCSRVQILDNVHISLKCGV